MNRIIALILTVVFSTMPGWAWADIFDVYGKKYGIQSNVLRSIATIESSLNPYAVNFDGESFTTLSSSEDSIRLIRQIQSYPYMVRVDIPGRSTPQRYFYDNAAKAGQRLAQTNAMIAKGMLPRGAKATQRKIGTSNFDVGLMQINFRYHGSNFSSLESMFDLHSNIDYAARLLRDLARRHGSMTKAIAHYHSSTDWRQEQYLAKFGSSYKRWERVLASGTTPLSPRPSQ